MERARLDKRRLTARKSVGMEIARRSKLRQARPRIQPRQGNARPATRPAPAPAAAGPSMDSPTNSEHSPCHPRTPGPQFSETESIKHALV